VPDLLKPLPMLHGGIHAFKQYAPVGFDRLQQTGLATAVVANDHAQGLEPNRAR